MMAARFKRRSPELLFAGDNCCYFTSRSPRWPAELRANGGVNSTKEGSLCSTDDSEGSFFSSRDSFAGLQGGFGTMRLGRTIGPVYYATYDYISMHNHDTGTSSDALLAGTVVGNQGFMDNTLWYTSPKFGPFTIDVAYSLLGEARIDPSVSQPRHLGLVGSYDQGPLHLALSFANTENHIDLQPGAGVVASKATA
jgi:predicted porin